jgi:hypothetical protein
MEERSSSARRKLITLGKLHFTVLVWSFCLKPQTFRARSLISTETLRSLHRLEKLVPISSLDPARLHARTPIIAHGLLHPLPPSELNCSFSSETFGYISNLGLTNSQHQAGRFLRCI